MTIRIGQQSENAFWFGGDKAFDTGDIPFSHMRINRAMQHLIPTLRVIADRIVKIVSSHGVTGDLPVQSSDPQDTGSRFMAITRRRVHDSRA
jgi:hypothetical protein